MRYACRNTPTITEIEDPTPPTYSAEPEYVKKLREDIEELTERVRELESANQFYHGGNSDDD